MQSWSDSFLNSVNDWSQVLGLVALFLTFVFGYLAYTTAKESARRSTDRENASEARANDLQKKADEAIQRAQALEARQAPRVLTNEQALAVTQELIGDGSPKAPVCFQVDAQSEDSLSYGNAIAQALVHAGYNVSPNASSITAGLGLDVTVSGPNATAVSAIVAALNNHGVRAHTSSGGGVFMGNMAPTLPGAITIAIGKKSVGGAQ